MSARFLLFKVGRALVTIWLVVTFAFVVLRSTGDPIETMLGDQADPAVVEHYRKLYGLDRPLYEQYVRYFLGIARADFGVSISDDRPVVAAIADALPATLQLGLSALAVAMLIGLPLGIVAALNRNKAIDRFVMTFAVLGFSIPNFFLGILLILVFSMWLRILPSSGTGSVWHLVMPAITLGTAIAGSLARFTRASMLDVLTRPYMRTAAAKGMPRRQRIFAHALPNAAIPLLTVLGLRIGDLVAGAIVIETVFAWPGVGRLLISSVGRRDLAVVQGVLIWAAFAMVIANLTVDLLYGWIDPRVRTVREKA